LLPELDGLAGGEIAARRHRGEPVEEREEADWMGYCGDTAIETLDENPRLYEVPVLLLECTFLADDSRERAARYGHVHFDDIAERRERFANRRLVLHHLSRRHSAAALRAAVEQELGALAGRVEVIAP
jgi:ribonuclease Z